MSVEDWRDSSGSHDHSPQSSIVTVPSPMTTITNAEFETLIDLLGTSDIESHNSESSMELSPRHVNQELSGGYFTQSSSSFECDLSHEDETGAQIPDVTVSEEDAMDRGLAFPASDLPNGLDSSSVLAPHPAHTATISQYRTMNELSLFSSAFTPISPKLVGADLPSSPMSPLQLSPAKSSRLRTEFVTSPHDVTQAYDVTLKPEGLTLSRNAVLFADNAIESNREGDTTPLQTEQFTHALAQARQQVNDLRSRIEQLRPAVKEIIPQRYHSQISPSPQKGSESCPLSTVTHTHLASSMPRDAGTDGRETELNTRIPEEINKMTDIEARLALSRIVSALSLSLASLNEPFGPNATCGLSPTTRSVSDIQRALSFVSRADELVWRRSSFPQSQGDTFGEENIKALMDRLTLWERAVRTRH